MCDCHCLTTGPLPPGIPAAVQSQQDYSWRNVRFGERFVEIYAELGGRKLTVDYGRIHDTEPVIE